MRVPATYSFWVRQVHLRAYACMKMNLNDLTCVPYQHRGGFVMLVPRATSRDFVRKGKRVPVSHVQLGLKSSRIQLLEDQPDLNPDTVAYFRVSAAYEVSDDAALFGAAVCPDSLFDSFMSHRDATVTFVSSAYQGELELWPGRLIQFSGVNVDVSWKRDEPPEQVQEYERRHPPSEPVADLAPGLGKSASR